MDITVASQVALPTLDRVQQNIQDNEHILEAIGVYMVASVVENFEEQGRPNRWADLKQETWEKKTGDMILHKSGLLKAATMYWVDGDTVHIGPGGPASVYFATHHFGDPDRNIPERIILLFQDEDAEFIRSFVREEIFQ